ncbi:hypothetical protein [Burkholderia gladioli]|uniref:hypothetical protein n=1 Tax=Burkholderia gladioli TaxID=28095 RepID=UPI001641A90D|nr:hypothetical protein [Burkholderia gladioli]
MNLTDLTQALRGGLIQQDRLIKADIPSLPADTMVPEIFKLVVASTNKYQAAFFSW